MQHRKCQEQNKFRIFASKLPYIISPISPEEASPSEGSAGESTPNLTEVYEREEADAAAITEGSTTMEGSLIERTLATLPSAVMLRRDTTLRSAPPMGSEATMTVSDVALKELTIDLLKGADRLATDVFNKGSEFTFGIGAALCRYETELGLALAWLLLLITEPPAANVDLSCVSMREGPLGDSSLQFRARRMPPMITAITATTIPAMAPPEMPSSSSFATSAGVGVIGVAAGAAVGAAPSERSKTKTSVTLAK